MIKYFGYFTLVLMAFAAAAFVGWYPHYIHQKELDKKHVFCHDCCWKTTMDNRSIYTCAETKEELWRKVP